MLAFANTEAGKSLQNIYRWKQFRTDEPDNVWVEYLGETANDFSHGILMYNTGVVFLNYEDGRFIPEKQKIFLMGLIGHDWGEAIINGEGVGDVGAYAKTGAIENKESDMARKAIASINIDKKTKKELVSAYEQVVEGKDPELQYAFKALEKTEYVITAMKLYQTCKKLRERGKTGIKQEEAFVGRVLVFDLPKVLDEYAPCYPNSIGRLLKNSAALIDEMFAYSLPWLMENKFWRGKEVDHAVKAEEFRTKWEAFKSRTV